MTEAEIQRWVEAQVNKQTFYDNIQNIEKIDLTIDGWESECLEESFSVDYMLKKSCYYAAKDVLNFLSELELVSCDKSISQTKGEILRPDLVCFNWEHNVVVLFELKENIQAARQAITELSAYEQEIENYLPFSSNCDIVHVIVSPEWSTLLDHSIAFLNMWGGKKVLGLNLDVSNDNWSLSPYFPNSWTFIRANGLPPKSIYTMNMVLYSKNGDKLDDEPPYELNLARELISREAEKHKASGLSLAWKNCFPNSPGKWVITVGVIHPIGFYKHLAEYGDINRESDFSGFLSSNLSNHEINPPEVLFRIADKARNILENNFRVDYEGTVNWEEQRSNISEIGFPIFGDFFGKLFDFAINRFKPTESLHDWNDPRFIIPLIDELTHYRCFNEGDFNVSEIFRIGCIFSQVINYFNNAINQSKEEDCSYYNAKLKWCSIECVNLMDRILEHFSDNKNIKELNISRSKDIADVCVIFSDWFCNELLVKYGNKYYIQIFNLGLGIGLLIKQDTYFEHLPDEYDDDGNILQIIKELFDYLNKHSSKEIESSLVAKADKVKSFFSKMDIYSFKQDANKILSYDNINIELINLISENLIPVLNHIMLPIYIETPEYTFENIDWDYLKNGAIKLATSGDYKPVLVLQNNGLLGIASSEEIKEVSFFNRDIDFTDEIYYLDKTFVPMIVIKSWDELKKEFSQSKPKS